MILNYMIVYILIGNVIGIYKEEKTHVQYGEARVRAQTVTVYRHWMCSSKAP